MNIGVLLNLDFLYLAAVQWIVVAFIAAGLTYYTLAVKSSWSCSWIFYLGVVGTLSTYWQIRWQRMQALWLWWERQRQR